MADRDRKAGGVTGGAAGGGSLEARQNEVYRKLIGVIDPELGLSIIKLGLVYDLEITEGDVVVVMTLTTPACPLGGLLAREVQRRVGELPWVTSVVARLVWEPRWTPAMMR